MQITWLGHAAFLIETDTAEGKVSIITDPYSSRSGYDPIHETADVVTLSHENPKYHSCLEELHGEPQIVRGLEIVNRVVTTRSLRIGAVPVFENEQGEGPNTMIWLESEGMRVLHMGDVGHPLSDPHVIACGQVHVLLAPTGGPPTIQLTHLKDFIERLRPLLIIPMHYGTAKVDMQILPVEEFTRLFPPQQVEQSDSATIAVGRHNLPGQPTVQVLQHAR